MTEIKLTTKKDYTVILNGFIDQHMPYAPPAYSCIYIYTLRNMDVSGESITNHALAEVFRLLESDVIRAWEYWEEKELVKITKENNEFRIEFLPLSSGEEEKIEDIIKTAPSYSPKELELYKSSYEEINTLFASAEKILGRLLNAKELSTLYSFYDWLRLPVDLIIYMLEYCGKSGHKHMNYIESVAIDWAENKIDSIEKAEDYIDAFNKDYRQILKALGLSGRNPAPIETEYMERWLKEYAMPLNIILEACGKTVLATGKGQFEYAEKIIKGWKDENVQTIEDIKRLEDEFKKKNQGKEKPAPNKQNQRVNRFANFNQRKRDYETLEKMEAELLMKGLKDKL